jgi:hypothetical protein
MPAKSAKQEKFMRAVAHSPSFAKKVGVPMSVGREFTKAEGGQMKESKAMMKKEVSFMKKKGAPKSMLKHEEAEMKGTKKMAMGGMGQMPPPTKPRRGPSPLTLNKPTGTRPGMAGGGLAAGHKSADGIAHKGKTKAKQVTMAGSKGMKYGGKC